VLTRRVTVAAVVAAATLSIAACSSSSGGSKAPTSSSTSAAPSVIPKVQEAIDGLTSVHLDTDTGTTKGTADVLMSNGNVTALHVKTSQDQVPYETVTTNGTTYLKLNDPVDGKAWAKVTSESTIPQVKIAASPLSNVSITSLLASPDSVSALLHAAEPVGAGTSENLNGVPTMHWSLTVDPAKVDTSTPIGQLIVLLGKDPIPVELWVDDQNRPVKMTFSVSLLGQKKDITVLLSGFDAPVTITAPAPTDVTNN
jgi:hypothetical protein